MFNLSLDLLIVLAIGLLVGMLIGNKEFRRKFFVGLRKFLAQLGTGARSYSKHYEQSSRERKQEQEESHLVRQHSALGKSKIAGLSLIICPQCKGEGVIEKRIPSLLDARLWPTKKIVCPTCKGKGEIYQ